MVIEVLFKEMEKELKKENDLCLKGKITSKILKEKRKRIIKKYKRQMGIDMTITNYSVKYYTMSEMRMVEDIFYMIDLFINDMNDFMNGSYINFYEEYGEVEQLIGFNENIPEPLAAFCNGLFKEYSLVDVFFTNLYMADEDFKHLCESKWGIKELKQIMEVGHRIKHMFNFFKTLKKMLKFIIVKILRCSIDEFDKKYSIYKETKNQFIIDMDVTFFDIINNKVENYSLVQRYDEIPFNKLNWLRTMSRFNPMNIIEKNSINVILYSMGNVKKVIKNMFNQYKNENNKKYSKQDIINISNEYNLTVETNNGHDKLCNKILDLIVRIMDNGGIYTNEYLVYLSDTYINTRNNRRIKKQGFIGSLDMYTSRLGIEKTPQALHNLLF